MTSPLFWFGVLLGVAVASLALALMVRGQRPQQRSVTTGLPDDALPSTPLQTRAYWGLVIGAISTAIAAVVVVRENPVSFHDNERLRLLIYGTFAAGAVAYGLVCLGTGRKHRGEVMLDERDHEILARAPRAQAIAIMVTLLIWAVALTETYWDSGSIPVAFPFLILLSSCVAGLLAFSAGIVIGYRRA